MGECIGDKRKREHIQAAERVVAEENEPPCEKSEHSQAAEKIKRIEVRAIELAAAVVPTQAASAPKTYAKRNALLNDLEEKAVLARQRGSPHGHG